MVDTIIMSASPRFVTLGGLPDELARIGVPRHLGAGEEIVFAGGVADGCYYVKQGLVGAYSVDLSGYRSLTFLLEESALFLESNAMEGVVLAQSDTASVFKAEVDTQLLFFPGEAFRRAMAADAPTANFVAGSIAQKMLAFRFMLNTSRAHSVTWRVANLFVSFVENCGRQTDGRADGRIKIDYHISQQLIADMLYANRVTVAKSIKRLKQMGCIEKTDDYYYVKDLAKLRRFLLSETAPEAAL